MKNLKDKVVMVTGASSGIGKACAIAFAEQGCDVVICARREKELNEVAKEIKSKGRDALAMTVDVSKEEDVKKLAAAAYKKFGKVDIVMSNAGIAFPGPTITMEKSEWEKVMNVNFYGCVHVVRHFVPQMVERKEGHVIVNSSGWGLMGGPYNSLYVTSKHALIGFSDCLRAEIRQHNVGVSTLAAGVVKTDIFATAEMKGFKESSRELVNMMGGMTTQKFAKKVIRGVKRNKGLMIMTIDTRIPWYFKRLFPRTFEAFLAMFAKFSNRYLED